MRLDPATSAGVWTIVTQSSTYIVNLDEHTLMRAPGVGGGDGSWEISDLRKDSEDVPLVAIERCIVGEPAQFLIEVVGDVRVHTRRLTTPVVSIERFV